MQFGINVKIIILNNNFLGMVRQWQELFHDRRYSSVDIESPDFVKLAEAYRIRARCVSERKDLESAIREMFANDDAYLLEVKVGKENNVFPMIPQGCGIGEIRLR
jgi:acetolactate synthase-1/2/3 large subunit